MREIFQYLTAVGLGIFLTIAYLSPNPNPEGWSDRVLAVYTSKDIVYVDIDSLRLYYESSEGSEEFGSFDELAQRVEKITAISQSPSGYAEDIRYQANQGYITAEVHPKLDNEGKVLSPVGKIDLYYSGVNWAVNPESDTTFKIITLDRVDSFKAEYDPCLSCDYTMWVAYCID